jgi:hypothetical protein
MIRNILVEICTKGSVYDEIINNIIAPNYHLKPELISELSISFLENEKKINQVIEQNYFLYYFIRAVKNNIHSNTSPFYKVTRIKDNVLYDNIELTDESDLELKIQKEEKFIQIDRAYTKIPKTYFQELVWHEYYTKGKTHRQIAKELNISHCLSFVEIKKIKEEVIKKINNF